ncbi:DUF6122 family protein [Flavobacterium sp.]|uniref:DUF6122 family protein n=1 Tax=Flavobacterium sp. TaxID=239 RepID=UPI0037BE7510
METITVLKVLQPLVHYSLHLLAPGLIAWCFFREQWKKTWGLFLLTMLVDLDHLFATPMFDPNRCGIGFHILHSYYAIGTYIVLLFFVKNKTFQIILIGLLFHMFTDFQDCLWRWYIDSVR